MAVVEIRWGPAMVDVAAYIGAGAVLPDSGLNPFDHGLEDTAPTEPTSVSYTHLTLPTIYSV